MEHHGDYVCGGSCVDDTMVMMFVEEVVLMLDGILVLFLQ
jgi:hypothetical protein